jgi:hypothetical protein
VLAGTLRLSVPGGANSVSFHGPISRSEALTVASYTLVITATNAAGYRSAPARLRFVIVK